MFPRHNISLYRLHKPFAKLNKISRQTDYDDMSLPGSHTKKVCSMSYEINIRQALSFGVYNLSTYKFHIFLHMNDLLAICD